MDFKKEHLNGNKILMSDLSKKCKGVQKNLHSYQGNLNDFLIIFYNHAGNRTQSDCLELVPAENAYTDKAHGYFRVGNMNVIQAAFNKNLFV